ncbi:trifunctional histidinol dehydrogenase [Serendipita sp. 399]|nr:trifunctional histidinol dehydrogenase [Serendipita sp. 399]
MACFLPLLADDTPHDIQHALERLGPLLITPNAAHDAALADIREYWVFCAENSQLALDTSAVIKYLDDGAQKAIVSSISATKLAQQGVPPTRLVLLLDVTEGMALSDKLRTIASGILLKTRGVELETIKSVKQFFPGAEIYVLPQNVENTVQAIRELSREGSKLVVSSQDLTCQDSTSTRTNVSDAFIASLVSDRPDGLFPTLVTSYAHNHSLGLVYSSAQSIRETILTGKGVYQSRKHGLWRKGETSGATQEVVRIRVDCDNDTLEFSVIQSPPGFCHLNRESCFGSLGGFAALEQTVVSRLQPGGAPEGSYTHRLFNDPDLLGKKIREEADELVEAQTREDIAFEAADLIYFAMVKCIKNGVRLKDVEDVLDRKACKVTRRKGDAKPQYDKPLAASTPNGALAGDRLTNGHTSLTSTSSSSAPAPQNPPPVKEDRIRMRSVTLDGLSSAERSQVLQRPVLKSDDMIPKVKPIVDLVRKEGDKALKELTAKFDKVQLESVVIRPPFFSANGGLANGTTSINGTNSPASSSSSSLYCLDGKIPVPLDPKVREAIDTAYANIKTFHTAQLTTPLSIETMPGVTCQRIAKPISRVGLYVPGGTAILPSTALMLGVPAQVAGCSEIVLATPPRRGDGTVSPEVLYVAHLVGATGIVKAGGAQAVAALAYGTETVGKVDKIFGPGNQWVTAAKMMVQNDSEANVAIDMPAGPSEVLVVADSKSNPAFVAADLLSQAEHGTDSQVVLVGINLAPEALQRIEDAVDSQARALPRVDIIRESIGKSLVVNTGSLQEAMNVSNEYAPEHLIINVELEDYKLKSESLMALVENAGSVFIGPFTPESCGDYASGTNHTLPTNGYARQYSGVNTQSFQKHITSQEITPEGLKQLGPVVVTLATCEGLDAHGNAVKVRLGTLAAATA